MAFFDVGVVVSEACGRDPMNILLHERWEDIESLSEHWNSLLAQSASDTIFLTWEWIKTWWHNYGNNRPLFVLSAWEGDSLLGLAPFYLDRISHLGMKWACLRLIGDGSDDSDYLDCIARRGREQDVIVEFVQYLESHVNRWDCLEIHGTPKSSSSLEQLIQLARLRSWRLSQRSIPCATLTLPHDWNDYLRLLKPRFRTKVRSTLSYFEDKVRATVAECRNAGEVQRWLPILFDMHTRRWQTKGRRGVFRENAKQNFYRDISQATLGKGWLAFYRLDWGNRPLAMQYGFVYDNRFFLLQEGYDPDFAALRPGLALRSWLLRHWIKTGLSQYDFLAGAAPYKLEWGAKVTQSLCLTIARSRPVAWVSFEQDRAAERAKDAIKSVIPDSILAWRKAKFTGIDSAPTVAHPVNGQVSSWSRRVAGTLYARTPLSALGRGLTTRYEFDRVRHKLGRRAQTICQILIYHRVNDDYDPYLPSVPVQVFKKQIEFLKTNFRVVSLDEIAAGSFEHIKEKYCVAVTFDDGYRDNFLHAFPILKNLAVPATIFLTTGSIEGGESSWYDQVSLAFKLTVQPHLSIGRPGSPALSLEGRAKRLEGMSKTLGWLRGLEAAERNRIIPCLFDALQVPATLSLPSPMLNWDEVRQMAKQNIAFGAHTVNHPSLAKLDAAQLHAEIAGSKNKIEEKLQLPVRHFAYPFGQPADIGPQAKSIVKLAGFSTAVTTIWGFNRAGDDLFELKRFNPWDSNPGIFAMMLDWYRLSGVS
jgi:peptidoglycan/xylan/chitin deacetylase (PgdA/CDA1 family)/CelD/BcsL family acetyltransferase involved in cellulose biosynthesis